jgi:hypothetical protein
MTGGEGLREYIKHRKQGQEGIMKTRILAACWGAACLALISGLAWAPPVQASTFGGRAIAAFVNTPATGPVYLSDSGELAPNGGWAGAGLLGTELPGVLSANVLNAATSGAEYEAGDRAHSSSSLADAVLLPGHLAQVTAAFVRVQVNATTMGAGGSPEISDLTFGGIPVTVTGLPNQTVQIPGVATLVINERAVTTDGVSHEITVNALRLTLVTGEEVILASARSLVNSAGQAFLATPAPPADLPPATITPPSPPSTPPPLDLPILPSPSITPSLPTPAPTPTNITPLPIVGSPNIKRGQVHSGSKNGPLVKDWNSVKSQDNCPSHTDQVRNVEWRSTERPPIIMASHREHCFPFDFVTGGGHFQPRSPGGPPKRVKFGFTAGFDDDDDNGKRPRLKGHFNLVDSNDGTRIKSVNVDTYEVFSGDPTNCRVFGGNARVTGPQSGTFRYLVGVCDYGGRRGHDDDDDDDDDDGAPGPDDRIRVMVCSSSPCDDILDPAQADVYFADNDVDICPADKPFCGDLDSGDIQLRKSKCNRRSTDT